MDVHIRPTLVKYHGPPSESVHGSPSPAVGELSWPFVRIRLLVHGHRGTVDSPPQNYYLGPPSESDHEVNGLGPMPWDKMSVRRPNGSSSVEAW